MVEVRACVYFFVLFLSFHVAVGKPFFGLLGYCDMFCDDDDASVEDFYDVFVCGLCEPSRPRTTTTPMPTTLAPPGATTNPGMPPSFNFVLPPSATATNLTLWRPNASSGWFMNMMPWSMGAPSGAAPPGPPGPPPPTAAPLVATTEAAAGTTPAAAAATTAAPAA